MNTQDNFQLSKRMKSEIKRFKNKDTGEVKTVIKTEPKKKRGLLTRLPDKQPYRGGILAAQKANKTVQSAGDVALSFVNPLIPAMKKGLKAKGIDPSKMQNVEIIEKFYNTFVAKKGVNNYEPLEEGELVNDPIFYQSYDSFDADNFLGLGAIKKIVDIGKKVVSKVKDTVQTYKAGVAAQKEARQAGEQPQPIPQPTAEQAVAKQTEEIMKKLEEKQKADQTVKEGNLKKYLIFGSIGLAVIILIVILIRRQS